MKYIFEVDINFIKNKLLKKIILHYLLLCGGYLLLSTLDNSINIDNFYTILGIKLFDKSNLLEITFYIFNFVFISYLSFSVFSNNFGNKVENIFLRMKTTEWITYKILSISCILITYISVVYVFSLVIFILLKINLFNILIIFLKNILYIIIIELISIIIYILISNKLIIITLINSLILLYFKIIVIDLINTSFTYLLVSIIILIPCIILLFKFNYFKLYENGR